MPKDLKDFSINDALMMGIAPVDFDLESNYRAKERIARAKRITRRAGKVWS